MLLQFKYILLFTFITLLHGKRKEKRDLSDLKDDVILSSLFPSDVKATRNDRSTTLKDELLAVKDDKSKQAQLNSILFPQKSQERRATDPVSEFMSLNNNVRTKLDNGQPNAQFFNAQADLTNQKQDINAQSDVSLMSFNAPIVNKQTAVPSQETAAFREDNLMDQQAAVNPALFASNFMPLSEKNTPTQIISDVSKKTIIPQSFIQQDAKPAPAVYSPQYKKSAVPLSLTAPHKSPSSESFPVQLRINSPNNKLRGIVPHVAEYGETVESIQQAQRVMDYKKSIIPQTSYSANVYKKDTIPEPPSPQVSFSKTPQKKSKVKTNKSKEASKKSKKTSKKSTDSKSQRQYIPQYQFQQQYGPYIANYQQQNPFSMQQSVVQYTAPQSSAQVQNMDGMHTRPLITDEKCADQYISCGDFAKNNYCTNFPELMKIQCRQSCGYCAPPPTVNNATLPTAAVASAKPTAPLAAKSKDNSSVHVKDDTPDVGSGSGESDAQSGSGETATPTVSGGKRFKVTNQAEDAGSGSGSNSNEESGNSESGSAESGSGLSDDATPLVRESKVPNLNVARSNIPASKVIPKASLGDFTFPVKKSTIPAAVTNADDEDESGSGSGSGDESGEESGSDADDAHSDKKSETLKKLAPKALPKPKPAKKKTVAPVPVKQKTRPTKKKSVVAKPSLPGPYPKIDLKAIASALAHYEEAALELAGEYPKPASDLTEYTRSFIPHPVNVEEQKLDKYRQNIQVAKIMTEERRKKDAIPKFLKLTKDVLKDEEEKSPNNADSLDSVRQRFEIPGLEPTLNDYYAETGKINPFDNSQKSYKKSRIEVEKKNKKSKYQQLVGDPYEYLRNMPVGASMEPIMDPKTRSTIPSDHSYPVFLMKVSPAGKKYIDEPASRRGKIRKVDAEGVLLADESSKRVVAPPPPAVIVAPPVQAPVQAPFVAPPPPAPFRAPVYQPQYAPPNSEIYGGPSAYNMQQQQQPMAAPQQPMQQAQAAALPPPVDFNNIEQATAPRASALFSSDEPVVPEKQPGMNSLRSKMLSAFFSVKNGNEGEDGEGSGGGSGEGSRRGHIQEPLEGSGASEIGSKKSISLHNLLFNENSLKGDDESELATNTGKQANTRKSQDNSVNYLQSNLAVLTPENGKPSFEGQAGLTSGRLGAQFTMSKMSKTQETNWVRPNAESELASAMPESSTGVETAPHTASVADNSELFSTLRMPAASFTEDQRPALRNVVPRVPNIKKKIEETKGSSKTIIPVDIFSGRQKIEESRPHTERPIQLHNQLRQNIVNKKLLSKDIFKGDSGPLSAPHLALASARDTVDKTILTDFPRSPFSINPKPIMTPPVVHSSVITNQNKVLTFNTKQFQKAILAKNNILSKNQASYSWRQYMPFNSRSNIARQNINVVRNNLLNNEKTSPLSAQAGSAKYALSNKPLVAKSAVAASKNKAADQKGQGKFTGNNYLVSPSANVRPLSFTTADINNAPSFKAPVRKNLIKQTPDLDCGDNWEGAQGDFGTFCYKQMPMKASFDNALAQCRRLNGDLFSVLNAYENRYLQDNIHEKFWIGYRDKGMNGNWNWTDSSESIYTNWGSEADDDNGKRHDCVYIDVDEKKWKDESCSKKKYFLCKKRTDTCPKDWKNLKLNSVIGCYKLFTDEVSWDNAEHTCEKYKAHLASIRSEDEQTMVVQVYENKSYWIGYNDKESEGDWQWTDRSTSSYENWDDKSPNNGGVSCAAMVEGGSWHDEPCQEKLKFVCKRKGPKPEKVQGLDDQGILLPVARLLSKEDTRPSQVYDELGKNGLRPVVPMYFWPLLKTTKSGMAGNRPMAAHGDVKYVPAGIALDGVHAFLDGGDFHGKCIAEPDKCQKGFAVAIQVFFESSVRRYKKAHCIIDTSGGGQGFTIYIADNKLNYKVISKDETWELKTDLTVGSWQEIVMTWHKGKGIAVYVNGAFKDSEGVGKNTETNIGGTTRLILGRENKDKGPYTCTKMVVASVAIFTKVLSIEDVPYAFTYGDTVVASYRWLMAGLQESVVPGAPEIETKDTITDVDGGIYIDGDKGCLEIDDVDPVLYNIKKSKHGFALSFKLKFDQRVRDYKQPKYILDTGGHVGGTQGVSVYIVNDNLYFQVMSSPDEDIMIWKVRVPIYTVRWQRIVMTWRLDKGLWVYLDGTFRGYTKSPMTLPLQGRDQQKRFYIGRRTTGTDYAGAQFAFGSLAIYGRFLSRVDTENVFGGADSPFPGIIREVWKNTPGETLKDLKGNSDYPNNPSTIEIIENFDAPFNVENNYGSKLKGYFIAPETGNSTFYLSCSKACELYFSGDDEAKNKTKIVSLSQSTWHNQWNKYENQSSDDIFLVAGKYYYLEAIHKGVDASDSLSVGVRMPTGRYQRPIIKQNLQWRLPGNKHAGLIREVWYNIPGYDISDITSNPNYPNRPSSTEVLDKFDAPFNVDDNYGSRISGYFHAPETGDYRFYLAADNSGELWISSDESEANAVKIITLNGWTDHNEWLKYKEQRSEKVFLAAGRYYFVRVFMKADKLGDCASVAVELPSGHFEGPIKKKHLSWKIVGSKDGPGPKEIIEPTPKPVGLFALNDASVKDILLPGENKLTLGDVDLTTGPGGVKDDAFLFKGNQSSYIEIPNTGKLDTKKSITLLANIFPTGENGPIINYKKDGWGVHLWQFSKTQLFARFVTRDGEMSTQPLGTHVLELNKWNQVGASYDVNSGVAQLWHDGKMVKSRNIGQIELLTNAPIRLGAREGDDRYFKGKISCVQIYDKALKEEQIGDLKHCPKSKGKASQTSVENDELTVFAQGSGMPPEVEESDAIASRIGDDTEEELIVQGEKSKATKCDPNPCKNDGTCRDDDKKIDGFVCKCSDDFTGKHCQVSKPAAENPVVKRTEIPKLYESKETSATYAMSDEKKGNTSERVNVKNLEDNKEDISLLYQKLGCFKDDATHPDLKTKVNIKKATQEECVKACALEDKSFSYFGLQNGSSCYCGKDYGKYGKLSDDACSAKCEGNKEESCGGQQANNIFFFGLGTNYTVKTFTGRKLGAGTDAKIYVEFIGERGSSDFRQLDSRLEKYEAGSVDQQTFTLPDLGKLKRMKILHDNSGSAPSWYLDKVQVTDEEGASFEFLCGDWLSDTQSGGKLERELEARSIIPSPT
ncbi:uncharacterized protein LOC130655679 isoform X2 [Hydractinia symbiolongicarpus]|uniref:uncharacterized protein LOC130655679 isoform X2 n=1 Tax=Hydractinia symbiolongicarpus TaxID=13093 RepID=UPI00254FEECD|nr:uncharacterized protein LOC130655679 isoform X2 [Hydractinia symbiolongicarpus]